MKLQLKITSFDGEPLPAGSRVNVEVRDTSLADAPSVSLKRANANVPRAGRTTAIPLSMEIAAVPRGTTVWAHVDVDRDGRVSKGDYVSVESYPVDNTPMQSLAIRVKKVA